MRIQVCRGLSLDLLDDLQSLFLFILCLNNATIVLSHHSLEAFQMKISDYNLQLDKCQQTTNLGKGSEQTCWSNNNLFHSGHQFELDESRASLALDNLYITSNEDCNSERIPSFKPQQLKYLMEG
ncbi:hypothetical protein FGO68_gene11576 [Halteria grandinella]|uniref:Uncharacterized protein n=1 Tax=Halteria grandinella TaxID=5974 RepID=A0A8J8NW02_HALGN|nr:hypothetical protein FGO68_gene11576 [Halteria grandinella]